jgi:hypothetical protein
VTDHEKVEFRNSLTGLYDDRLALKEATAKPVDAAKAHQRIAEAHEGLAEKERARETGEQA